MSSFSFNVENKITKVDPPSLPVRAESSSYTFKYNSQKKNSYCIGQGTESRSGMKHKLMQRRKHRFIHLLMSNNNMKKKSTNHKRTATFGSMREKMCLCPNKLSFIQSFILWIENKQKSKEDSVWINSPEPVFKDNWSGRNLKIDIWFG